MDGARGLIEALAELAAIGFAHQSAERLIVGKRATRSRCRGGSARDAAQEGAPRKTLAALRDASQNVLVPRSLMERSVPPKRTA